MKYTSIQDVISYAVEPALGEFVDDFDTEAIANEIFEFVADVDEGGIQHGNGYFVEREGMDWDEIMQRHDHGEQLDSLIAAAWDGDGTYAITETDGDVNEVECGEKNDLKHAVSELLQYAGNWDEKIGIAKIPDDGEMTDEEHEKAFIAADKDDSEA